jgi:hypothetical protein
LNLVLRTMGKYGSVVASAILKLVL